MSFFAFRANLYSLAKLCELVTYENEESVKEIAKIYGYETLVLNLANTRREFGIFKKEGMYFVVFSGTEPDEYKDVFTDIKFIQKKTDMGKVHKGFWKRYLRYRIKVLKHILNIKKAEPEAEIVFVGHSLGGAMALLFGQAVENSSVITFGQPRVGDKRFVENSLKKIKNYLRFTAQYDIIPHVPPKFLGYAHGGNNIYLFRTRILSKEWFKERIRSYLLIWGLYLVLGIPVLIINTLYYSLFFSKNHGIKNYQDLILFHMNFSDLYNANNPKNKKF